MQYFTLLTAKGAEKIAAATAANKTIALTHIALGDGNGSIPMPNATKTALVKEVYRASLNDLRVDANNSNWVVAEAYVPAGEGNFWIREVGVFDADGDLIAIGNYPETYKPVTADGVAKDLYMKVIFEVSSSDAVTLQVDPSVVMASQEYVNEKVKNKAEKIHEHKWTEIKEKPPAFPPSDHTHEDIKQRVPTGSIITFPSGIVPSGFLECNGAELSRTAYPSLFAIIGTIYGTGDGSTTFRLPDLRGEFIRGWDNGRGIDTGRVFGNVQSYTTEDLTLNLGASGGGAIKGIVTSSYGYVNTITTVQNIATVSGTGNETRPRNVAMMYCIKY